MVEKDVDLFDDVLPFGVQGKDCPLRQHVLRDIGVVKQEPDVLHWLAIVTKLIFIDAEIHECCKTCPDSAIVGSPKLPKLLWKLPYLVDIWTKPIFDVYRRRFNVLKPLSFAVDHGDVDIVVLCFFISVPDPDRGLELEVLLNLHGVEVQFITCRCLLDYVLKL